MEDIKAVTGNAATYKAAALMSDSEKAYLVKINWNRPLRMYIMQSTQGQRIIRAIF